MARRFWILNKRLSNGFEESLRANGWAGSPFRLPGITCPECRDSWAGQRVLPVECPKEFQDETWMTQGKCVALSKFRKIRDALEPRLTELGFHVSLRPGDGFQPTEVRFVGRPTGGFFWPAFGYPIISGELGEWWMNNKWQGATLLRVHARATELRPNERLADVLGQGMELMATDRWHPLEMKFYVLLVMSESGLPAGSRIVRSCEACEYQEVEHAEGNWLIADKDLPDLDVFFIKGTQIPVVSDAVADGLRKLDLRRMQFELVPLQQP